MSERIRRYPMKMLRQNFAVVALAIGLAAVGSSQVTGGFEGTVYDPDGQVVPSVNIRVVEVSTDRERLAVSDGRGWFHVAGLPPGEYRFDVSHRDFAAARRQGVDLVSGRSVRLDFHLKLAQNAASIDVVAPAPLVDLSSSDWGGSTEKRKLEDLPLNGRDLFDLASQEPGAHSPVTTSKSMLTGLGVQLSVNGGRPNQNSFRTDGVYVNNAANAAPTSAAGRLLGVEGVQELRLITSPYSAELGRAAGAILTAVSRSGGNDFHGSAFWFLRHSALDAKNYFDQPSEDIPPLRRHQFGGSLGGPIRRHKTYFFLNYEGLRETEGETILSLTPTQGARNGFLPGGEKVAVNPVVKPYLDLYPLPNGRDFGDGTAEYIVQNESDANEDHLSGKVDHHLSDQLRLSGRYTQDISDVSATDPFGIWTFVEDSRFDFLHSDLQFAQSANTLHNFRFGYSRIRNTERSRLPPGFPSALSYVAGQPLGSTRVSGLSDLGGLNVQLRPRQFLTRNYQTSYEGNLVRGLHSMKFGGGYDAVVFDHVADNSSSGVYVFGSLTDFLLGKAQRGDVLDPNSSADRQWRQHNFNAFIQDQFRPVRRLDITLGIRYETYTTPTEAQNRIATLRDPLRDTELTLGSPLFENPSRMNFGPRAALAWDVTGGGTTVLRAGAGIFFDLIGTRELILSGVRMPPYFNRLRISYPGFPDIMESTASGQANATIDGLDYWLQQPYMARYQMALQHQIGSNTMIEGSYVGSRGIHLIGHLAEINVTQPDLSGPEICFPEGNPRLNPAQGPIRMRKSDFNSYYHGLQLSLRHRLSNGFRIQGKYTWSKLIDENSGTVFSDTVTATKVPTVFDYRQNRGPSDFDVRHAFTADFSYELPDSQSRGAKFFGGWQLHGLLTAQSGPPFSALVGYDRLNITQSREDLGQRPNLAGNPDRIILGDPRQFFDPLAFELPPAGYYGNLGRNRFEAPGLVMLNLAAHKAVWKTERQALTFRLEVFNAANTPNFQVPEGLGLFNSRGQRLSSAGRITSTTTISRQIQLALKWVF